LIDESAVSAALREHSGEKLRAALSSASLQGDALECLLGLLRRSGQLVFRYPDRKEGPRDRLFVTLRSILVELGDSNAQARLENELEMLATLEGGYRGILDLLRRTAIGQRPHEIQASAALGRFAEQVDILTRQVGEATSRRTEFTLTDELRAIDAGGEEYSADAVVTGLLQCLRITLLMLGNQAKWFNPSRQLVLPSLPVTTEVDRFQAGSSELLAASWRSWEAIDQKCRFLGGKLEILSGPSLPADRPQDISRVVRYRPHEVEIVDWIANERAAEFEMQNFAQLLVETGAADRASGIEGEVRLLPDAFVSLAELHADGYLTTVLGAETVHGTRTWGGLRLVEWLRGYSVMRELASEAFKSGATHCDRHLSRWSSNELRDILIRLGLSAAGSTFFLDAVTLGVESQDLFDCPLVRLSDGSLLLVAPAARDVVPAKVVLSRLYSLDFRFENKGTAFEQTVLKFFKEKGFEAYCIDTSRNGESYEIDALVPWGDYLFVFECKNRSLSAHHPVQAYHFAQDRDSFVKQIKRQVHALLTYPDISTTVGGPDPRTKIIVPCVLYNLPYAVPGRIDGVYVTDWSSLARFFRERYVHIKVPHRPRDDVRLLHRTAIYSFWNGSEPTPVDLLRHLDEPFQVRAMGARRVERQHAFPLGEGYLGVATVFERRPASVEFFADLCGFDAKEARRVQRGVAKLAKTVRKQTEARERHEAKRQEVRLARRWRADQKRRPPP